MYRILIVPVGGRAGCPSLRCVYQTDDPVKAHRSFVKRMTGARPPRFMHLEFRDGIFSETLRSAMMRREFTPGGDWIF